MCMKILLSRLKLRIMEKLKMILQLLFFHLVARSERPVPSNLLHILVSRMKSQQQVKQDAIYEEAHMEDSIL